MPTFLQLPYRFACAVQSRRNTTRPRFVFFVREYPIMLRTTGRFLLVALVVGTILPQVSMSAQPNQPSAEATRFDAYNKPDGDSYFALSLMPKIALPPADATDVVV